MRYTITVTKEAEKRVYRAVIVDEESKVHTAVECEDFRGLFKAIEDSLHRREIEEIRKWDPNDYCIQYRATEDGKDEAIGRYYMENGLRFDWNEEEKKYTQSSLQ